MAIIGTPKNQLSPYGGPRQVAGPYSPKVETVVLYTNLPDAILGATGGTTIPDGLRSWYSATTSESINDAERRWLLAQAATSTGTNNDLWMQFLDGEGYAGTINDRKFQYWKAQ